MTFFNAVYDIDIILASQSPRRRDLLQAANIPFRIWTIPVEEDYPSELKGKDVAEYLCKHKAAVFQGKIPDNGIVITADTIVVKDNQTLNKAIDENQAFSMLRQLSGSQHEVITGVCLSSPHYQFFFNEVTRVFFRELEDDEIKYYITNYQPFDKAGSYGIQEWIGSVAVTKIEGSYENVVGLPVARLYDELKNFITTRFLSDTKKKSS